MTACLQGESGAGKEVIARFIHASSLRRHGPFIAINCAALPGQLVESELFGFERETFTSAQQSTQGLIELARGGALFLDEITELTLSAQASRTWTVVVGGFGTAQQASGWRARYQ